MFSGLSTLVYTVQYINAFIWTSIESFLQNNRQFLSLIYSYSLSVEMFLLYIVLMQYLVDIAYMKKIYIF